MKVKAKNLVRDVGTPDSTAVPKSSQLKETNSDRMPHPKPPSLQTA